MADMGGRFLRIEIHRQRGSHPRNAHGDAIPDSETLKK
jgi:hypothetical protein